VQVLKDFSAGACDLALCLFPCRDRLSAPRRISALEITL